MLLISSFSAAFLALFLVILTFFIVSSRAAQGIVLGHDGSQDLQRKVRAHANFVEYVPIFLILLVLVEINHFSSPTWIWIFAGLFILGRILHALSILYIEPKFSFIKLRVLGMLLTLTGIIKMSVVLLFNLVKSFL